MKNTNQYIELKNKFLSWCDEPMSANGNDREEMFEQIYTQGKADARKEVEDAFNGSVRGINPAMIEVIRRRFYALLNHK